MTATHPRQLARTLYRAFIKPAQTAQPLRSREIVFNVILLGTGLFMATLFVLLLFGFVIGNTYVISRLAVAGGGFLYLTSIFILSRHMHYTMAASLLLSFYIALAVGCVVGWGIDAPFGILLFGLSIVLASTILASKQALYVAAIACLTTIGVQVARDMGFVIHTWQPETTYLGDAVGYSIVYFVLAIISWLFGQQMERSLQRAEHAENELAGEKATLEVRVAERSAQLKQVQLEEMQQLYHFADIGQLSTALLHDLANHLTVLTMEIEGLQKTRHAAAISRSQRIISQLDVMVDGVRDRLQGTVAARDYNLVDVVREVVEFAQYKHGQAGIPLRLESPTAPKDFSMHGDPLKLNQIITILVTNAYDAYNQILDKQARQKGIHINIAQTDAEYSIIVIDYGKGITPQEARNIFRPSYSTKRGGMGIGLYLAKQMVQTQFSGTLTYIPSEKHTAFLVTIPKKHDTSNTSSTAD